MKPGFFAHAFSLESEPLTAEDRDLVRRLTSAIAERRMATPAVFALEAHRPLHRMAAQGLTVLAPTLAMLSPVFRLTEEEYARLARVLESTDGFELLLAELHAAQEGNAGA